MLNSVRTFFLTCQTPYPPVGGAALRNWQNINILKSFGPVSLFSIPLLCNQVEYSPKMTLPGVEHWEEHGVREERGGWSRKLWKRLNIYQLYRMDAYYRDDIARELDQALLVFKPDLVVVSEIGLSPYLKVVQRHSCKVIFDDHNVEAPLFQEKFHAKRGIKGAVEKKFKYLNLKALEKASIKRADQVWLCSEVDCQLVTQVYGDSPNLRTVPNGINIEYYAQVKANQCIPRRRTDAGGKTIIFVGTFGYLPNRVAARWLIEEIFPMLQEKHPDSCLILAGANPTPEMLEAERRNPNITVTGRVEDLRSYIANASVVIIPLLQGGGTRLKILEAFAAGRAVVSTSKGAEGLGAADGEHLLIRDSTSALVSGVCEIWSDPNLEKYLISNAFELVKSQYSWEAIASYVRSNVEELFC